MKRTIKIIGSVWIICGLVMILSAGGEKRYNVSQSNEDLMPSCKYSCDVYKILFLNQDSLVIQYVPKRGEVMIGGGPVTYKRIIK